MTKEARTHKEEKQVSSISGAGKTGQLHVKKLEHSLIQFIKVNSKWIKERPKTAHYKTPKGKHRQNTLT